MKIKDLPKDRNIDGVRFAHPETGKPCFLAGVWSKGAWYRTARKSTQIHPLFLEDGKQVLEFEVLP